MLDLLRRKAASSEVPEKKSALPSASVLDRIVLMEGQSGGRPGAFARNVVAYRCVRMIAEGAASVPVKACGPGGETREDHPLCGLLAAPNPDQTGPELLEQLYGQLQLHGDAFLEAVRRDGRVVALYVLRADRVSVETGEDGWPSAYLYGRGGTRRRLSRGRDGFMPVLHVKLIDPLSDSRGLSPLSAAMRAVATHDAACEWNEALLKNAARPSGAVVHKGTDGAPSLTGEQFDRLKAELEASFQGGRNAGRPMVLDGGLDWQPMGMSPAEMDFIALKHAAARDIALAFGVPPQLLGIPGDNTYSNYREANLAFWRQTVLPLVAKFSSALSAWIGDGAHLFYDAGAVDALSSERSERLDRIAAADFLTDDEKRAALGFPARAS